MYNPILVSDGDGKVLGKVHDLFSVLQEGQYRCASSIFLFDAEGNILIQKRSQHIAYPGLLDKSVGGHVDEGETHIEAAFRELHEELGISSIELTEVIPKHIFEGYLVHVYKGAISSTTSINFDPHEIEAVYWKHPKEITEMVTKSPELFTPNFVDIWQRHHAKIIAT